MKKMLSAFFGGCIIIGLGLGIFAIEVSGWKLSDQRYDLAVLPAQTYEYTLDFNTNRKTNIDVYYPGNNTDKNITVARDSNYTDKIKIAVTFRGVRPDVYPSTYTPDENEAIYYNFWIDTNNYEDIEQTYRFLKLMFENKTYYHHGQSCLIDSVTIYTARPENINLPNRRINPVITDTVAG